MFPFPPPPPGPSGSPSPTGISAGERAKVLAMAVALLLVSGWFAFQWGRGTPPAPATTPGGAPAAMSTEGTKPVAPADPATARAPQIEFSPAPLFPEEEAAEVELRLRERLTVFPGIRDGVPDADPAPYGFLLEEAVTNYRIINLSSEGYAPLGPLLPYQEKPGEQRGRLVAVSGELVSLERHPHEAADGLVKEIRRGVLRTDDGRWVTFSWPVTNPLIPDEVRPGDGWARVRGIFFKGWNTTVEGVPEPVFTAHLVLTAPPLKDFRPVTVTDIDPSWYAQVRDATPAEAMVREYPPFFLLLNMVDHFGPDGFEAWAKAKQEKDPGLRTWPPENFTDRSPDLIKAPEQYRFRTVSYSGYLKQPRWVYDLKPNPGNVKNLWLAFVVASDFVPVWVYSTKSFVDQGIKDGDRVRVNGFFMQRVTFMPRGGKEMLQAPVLIAATVRHEELPESRVTSGVIAVVAAIAGLLLVALCFALVQGRRDDRRSAALRLEKARARRLKEGGSLSLRASTAGGDAATPSSSGEGDGPAAG